MYCYENNSLTYGISLIGLPTTNAHILNTLLYMLAEGFSQLAEALKYLAEVFGQRFGRIIMCFGRGV